MALFISFEGGEGAGKTTQARYLYGMLCQRRLRARILREPGGTALGEMLRNLISVPRQALASTLRRPGAGAPRQFLAPPQANVQLAAKELWLAMAPQVELFLFLASRAQLVAEVIRPALARDITIICDRYIHSTLAYQGYGRGLDLDFLRWANQVATGGLEPDLVVFLDMEASRGLERKRRVQDLSRFEEEEMAFHQRVRQGYREMALADPARWLVIDASLPRKEVSRLIWERVQPHLPPRLLSSTDTAPTGEPQRLL